MAVGIELMPRRVERSQAAAKATGIQNANFVAGDVLRVDFSAADVVFLFDPFTEQVTGQVTGRLEVIANSKPLVMIDYYGNVIGTASWATLVSKVEAYHVYVSTNHLEASRKIAGFRGPESVLFKRGPRASRDLCVGIPKSIQDNPRSRRLQDLDRRCGAKHAGGDRYSQTRPELWLEDRRGRPVLSRRDTLRATQIPKACLDDPASQRTFSHRRLCISRCHAPRAAWELPVRRFCDRKDMASME